jgi:hypothetical protein
MAGLLADTWGLPRMPLGRRDQVHEDFILLNKPHFAPGPLFNGVSTCGKVLHFGRQSIVARRQRLIGLLLCCALLFQLAHTLPSPLAPPQGVLDDGSEQYQNDEQQAHVRRHTRHYGRVQAQRRL